MTFGRLRSLGPHGDKSLEFVGVRRSQPGVPRIRLQRAPGEGVKRAAFALTEAAKRVQLLLPTQASRHAPVTQFALLAMRRAAQRQGNAHAHAGHVPKDVLAFTLPLAKVARQVQVIKARKILHHVLAEAVESHTINETVVADETDHAITPFKTIAGPAKKLNVCVIESAIRACV